MVSIGELARATGLPVRTIRFYCDEGIVQAHRSQGGHRLFDEDARNQLVLIRRLRALGLGLDAITEVLRGEQSIAEVVAVENRTASIASSRRWHGGAPRCAPSARPRRTSAKRASVCSPPRRTAAPPASAWCDSGDAS
ncbi:MerR family transcriptional regulator [Nocardia sp. NPDC056064]|uniref:MerR family transcriptional regulator n=1 Tax=Nocardia sp. NPDC056064 TaxID=3345701 RepID=UPI0035E09C6C